MIDRSQSAPLTEAPTPGERPVGPGLARLVSLTIAITLLLALAFYPSIALRGDALMTQAVMPVLLIGIGGCVAHGLGWRPRSSIFAAAAGPFVAWPLTLAAFAFLAVRV